MRIALTTLIAAVCLAAPMAAVAQDYPTRQVNLVVPFAPGGTVDVMGRYLAEKLSSHWDQTVVVENRPGAGSMLGAAYVSQARPDGHTLLVVSGSYTTNAAIQKNLPFDPATGLTGAGLIGTGHYLLISGKRHPVSTLGELVEKARTQKIFYGTTGVGSIAHLSGQLLNDIAGIDMQPVHYEGGSPAMVDLGGGRLDIFLGSPAEAATGFGTPIATLSGKRVGSLPDLQTVVEAGYPDAEVTAWWGVLVPADTPAEVVNKLNADINAVMNSEDGVAFLTQQGADPTTLGASEVAERISGELVRWRELAEKHDIQAD